MFICLDVRWECTYVPYIVLNWDGRNIALSTQIMYIFSPPSLYRTAKSRSRAYYPSERRAANLRQLSNCFTVSLGEIDWHDLRKVLHTEMLRRLRNSLVHTVRKFMHEMTGDRHAMSRWYRLWNTKDKINPSKRKEEEKMKLENVVGLLFQSSSICVYVARVGDSTARFFSFLLHTRTVIKDPQRTICA